jgi:PilZ domain
MKRETRTSKRKPFDYVGLLDYRDGKEPRPCQIMDISAGGARLSVFTDPRAIPNELILLLSPTAAVRRACEVVWRSNGGIGVRFLKSQC